MLSLLEQSRSALWVPTELRTDNGTHFKNAILDRTTEIERKKTGTALNYASDYLLSVGQKVWLKAREIYIAYI